MVRVDQAQRRTWQTLGNRNLIKKFLAQDVPAVQMQADLTSHGTEGLQCTWRQDKILDHESPEYDGENGPESAAQPATASLDTNTLVPPVTQILPTYLLQLK